MTTTHLQIRLATVDQQRDIIGLISAAADWLGSEKQTSQWSRPWPSRRRRNQRIRAGLRRGRTWIAWDGDVAAGSVTVYTYGSDWLWSEEERRQEAVYLHRLVINRDYAGTGLGRDLLNWGAQQGKRENPQAELVRIDVWTDNTDLHGYYKNIGFDLVDPERVTPEVCPSGALFQMHMDTALEADTTRLQLQPTTSAHAPRPHLLLPLPVLAAWQAFLHLTRLPK